MEVEFVSSVSVIAADPSASRRLYVDALGLPLESRGGDEYHWTDQIEGSKHFGVWPLWQAAQACFGTAEWPHELPVPQVSIEFDVASVERVQAAAEELQRGGYELLHPVREEPWGQTVVRLLSLEGSIVGISYAPVMHS